jgi:hypothetical protein
MEPAMTSGSRNQFTPMSSEMELILCCARSHSDPANDDRIRSLLRGGLDWTEVMRRVNRHRVAPIVHEKLADVGGELLPEAQQEALREAAWHAARFSLASLRELVRLHDLFEAAGVSIIPYKGPALAWIAYGSFTRRDFVDLDFVLQQRDIPEATLLMRRAGYRAEFDLREAHDGVDKFAPGQYSFSLPDQTFQVELHTERTMRYFPIGLDLAEMRRRMIPVDVAGRRLHTFSLEDTLAMVCVHGAKHFWDRLSWILDVAQLTATQGLNWALALQVAEEMQSTRLLLLGLELAHDLLGARLPEFIIEKARVDSNVCWLAERVHQCFDRASEADLGMVSRTAFRWRSRDAMGQGIRHMLRLVASPTESDREMMHLPQALAPLYIFLRPIRLLRDHGVGSRRRT